MSKAAAAWALCMCGLLAGCPSSAANEEAGRDASALAANDAGAPIEDFVAKASDFECLSKWTQVRAFYLTNKLGKLDAALAVADAKDGGKYPVGTIIQLIPSEAMVKRRAGFSAKSGDWEFFSLSVSGKQTTILKRGTSDVVNQFNANCMSCHAQAEPKYDFVCEENHGCAALPLTPQLITSIQTGDSRCK